jgi:hypothetical protein
MFSIIFRHIPFDSVQSFLPIPFDSVQTRLMKANAPSLGISSHNFQKQQTKQHIETHRNTLITTYYYQTTFHHEHDLPPSSSRLPLSPSSILGPTTLPWALSQEPVLPHHCLVRGIHCHSNGAFDSFHPILSTRLCASPLDMCYFVVEL